MSNKYEGAASLDCAWKEESGCLWVVDVVEDVGLETCERGVSRANGPRLLSCAECQWYIAPMTTTWRKRLQLRVQVEEEIGESHGKEQGEEQTVKERTTLRRA